MEQDSIGSIKNEDECGTKDKVKRPSDRTYITYSKERMGTYTRGKLTERYRNIEKASS
jgi:hypothetical protein